MQITDIDGTLQWPGTSLSIETNANESPAEWLEGVTDEEYNNLK